MFTRRDIDGIDTGYFEILQTSPFALTLRSRCTGHEWHLIVRDNQWNACEIYHRHNASKPWHRQWGSKTLHNALAAIREHDTFHLNGRKY